MRPGGDNAPALRRDEARERWSLLGLSVPALFLVGLVVFIPVGWLFWLSLVDSGELSLIHYRRLADATHFRIFWTTFEISFLVTALALLLGYPLAYLIAKTRHPGRNTFLMILVLAAMQLDMVIRLYGMMVLLGDRGLINSTLIEAGLISSPLPLMYNTFGVVVGLVQFTLPFMVLSLIGVIRGIDPSLEEAARSLGASRLDAFRRIVLPLSMPGILAGTLLVFALSISSYVVPALMGGWKVVVLPIHIYQQVAELGNWQFGAAIAVVLFALSLLAVIVYQRAAMRASGGRA